MRYFTVNADIPPPTDPTFVPPMPTPEDFLSNGPEDEDLLLSGKWDDQKAPGDDVNDGEET